jgi:hypothetical protein
MRLSRRGFLGAAVGAAALAGAPVVVPAQGKVRLAYL